MIRRLLLIVMMGFCLTGFSQQQSGGLKGTVRDIKTKEPLAFASVLVKVQGEVVDYATTDYDGKYSISPLQSGKYDVEFSMMGYQDQVREGITVGSVIKILDFDMTMEGEMLIQIDLVEPMIQPGQSSGGEKKKEDIENLPIRDAAGIATLTPGVTSSSSGISIKGARPEGTQYLIDGVKVRGNVNIPRDAIAKQEVFTGGLPAMYGDVTGGVISTTTRGGMPNFFGSAEYVTTSPFDLANNTGYHYNLGALTIGGPIYKKKLDNGNMRTVISYLLSTEFQYSNDARPLVNDVYRVNDEKQSFLEKNPLRASVSGNGTLNEADFLTYDDMTTQAYRENVDSRAIRSAGNMKIQTGDRTFLTLGGRYNYNKGRNYNYGGSLMNYNSNGESMAQTYAVYARFQQSFASNDSSLFKNVFYTVQVDYTRNWGYSQDVRHKDNYFAYGHVGKFETFQTRGYELGSDTITDPNDPNYGKVLSGWVQTVWADTAVHYTPGDNNEIRANYTSSYYDMVNNGDILNATNSINNIRQGGGLLNGDNPNSVYGLWSNVGTLAASYSKYQNSQFRLTANSTFNIKDHSVVVGIEYEQRVDRSWGVAGNGLWTQMRLLQNDAIRELDLSNPIAVYDANGVFQDTLNYNRLFDSERPRTFDRNVRKKLGLDENGTDWLDIDSYDPSFFSLDMFSANELLNLGGSQLVSYYGYDVYGNVLSTKPTLADFYREDSEGNSNRLIGAFEPIYMAGYIQDQFTFNDLFFNVGVRVERFDANQSVLKDPYTLYPAYTRGELGSTNLPSEAVAEIPSNIGDNYVVYVNDIENPTSIVGYRDGNTWYDAKGDVETNPKNIADLSGGIKPYLKYPDNQELSYTVEESFVDYTPQVTVSPRIAFQFPITDEAEFFAHYDLLVQRPSPGLNRMNPINYLLLEIGSAPGFIANPDLEPQKTTDYEIGFRQALSLNSTLKISAFYREMRDMMQTVSLNEAYPITYVTYGNQDFGTVKGFTFEYNLRRSRDSKLAMTANYTLQFADGSGSGPNSGANLARSGQPNLRYILPLDYDTRHQFTLNLDYRFGPRAPGKDGFWDKFFANSGVNLLVNLNSGEPYTARSRAYALTEAGNNIPLVGQINGSRLPWQSRLDLNINKIWVVTNEKGKAYNIEVYLTILNLLNQRNVNNVYAYTGSPDDDGFLSSPQGINSLAFQTDAQAYTDLYNIAMNNPFNFTAPRQFRLGFRLGF